MLTTRGYAATAPEAPLAPFQFERRAPGPKDVLIRIDYCGICHSDIHSVRNEWHHSTYPLVPGHEIAGRVVAVGNRVKRFKPGDAAGVGCYIGACRRCDNCRAGDEQYCQVKTVFTYGDVEPESGDRTYGGYSSQIVVDEDFAFKLPPTLPLAEVAPLLCAGITTYSPLKRWEVGSGRKVGVIGLGGLGHLAVKFAATLGAEVTVFSTSPEKAKDAKRFGAAAFVNTAETGALDGLTGRFHFLLDTVSAPHDYDAYLQVLRRDGALVLVGLPDAPATIQPFSLIGNRRTLAGSLIGGLKETQEMLDYCARKRITADVELIPVSAVNEAFDRAVKGDVKYRFVLDMKTLGI